MKNRAVSLIAGALFALSGCAAANPYDLPNDCAIIATEAYARLSDCTPWCRILRFDIVFPDHAGGHAVCVWQIVPGGKVCVYDRHGAADLDTTSRDPKDIVATMQKSAGPGVKLVAASARFIQ